MAFQRWIQRHQVDLLAGNLLAVIVFFLFTPVIAYVNGEDVDYGLHTEFIAHALNGQPIDQFLATVPHFLYHLSVVAVYRLLGGLTLPGSVFIVTLGYYIAGALAIYWMIGRLAGPATTYPRALLYAGMALTILLAAPITLLTPENRYMGYILNSAYHNPTIVALKPFALILFGLTIGIFGNRQRLKPLAEAESPLKGTTECQEDPIDSEISKEKVGQDQLHSFRYAALCGLLVVMSILAKPNYVMAFLPGIMLAAGWALLRRWDVHWGILIGGIILPAGVILGGQALLFGDTGGIIFSPLAVMYEWDRIINPNSSNGLILKFVLSALFPLCVYVCYWRQAWRTFYLNLAWLIFIIGAAYGYLLAESGERLGAGNFTWSGQITLLVLFATSAGFFLSQRRTSTGKLSRLPVLICAAALGLHLISGFIWYNYHTGWAGMSYLIERVW